nr:nucleotidyltransferase family protein [uncultured Subdoligranulum sp.]
MDFVGIITEYDPFHNGHAAQLTAVRQAGAQCIAVCMSAGAVQRGGVPILPETVRVQAALAAGADLVVALPAPYACTTAEQFAAAGVSILAAIRWLLERKHLMRSVCWRLHNCCREQKFRR